MKKDVVPRQIKKVAVVGAGAAGLTAAWFLEKRGYEVTVFEKADRVGGKCFTIEDQGFAIDIGAHEMLAGYGDVMAIAKAVGARSRGHQNVLVYNHFNQQFDTPMQANKYLGYTNLQVGLAALKYMWLSLTRYGHFGRPGTGLANAPAELLQPVGSWMKQMGIEALTPIVLFVMKVQGYGRLDEVSAAHFVKFQGFANFASNLLHTLGLIQGWPRVFVNGFENLWQRVAHRLKDVRLDANITSILRQTKSDANTVGVQISVDNGEPEDFDQLILACPFDLPNMEALGLDIEPGERELFSKIENHTFVTTAVRMKGLPTGVVGTIPLPALGDYTGYIKVYEKSDTTVFFTLTKEASPEHSQVLEQIKETIEAIPAQNGVKPQMGEVIQQKTWPYFPHPSLYDMADGYFDKFQALQGHRATFYTGSLLEMENVGNTVANAKHLIETLFPKVR